MPIAKLLIAYLLISLVFFLIDMIWLGWLAKDLYQKNLAHLLSPTVNWTAAAIFYALYIIGIMVFCILPAVDKGSLSYAITYGAFFGFITYATYDLTNLATLRDWPVKVVLMDISWGAVLCLTVSTAGYYIVQWLSPAVQ
ncbi:MAG: DUF2177 family protein [Bacteroidota bacterium]